MDVFTTIITGVIVFTFGQIILKLVIEPIQKLRSTISDVAFCLKNDYVYYMHSDDVPTEDSIATYKRLRELGSKLHADLCAIPGYSKYRKIFLLPEFNSVVNASDKMFAISS